MHAADETLSIHPREFIFFSYWGGGDEGWGDASILGREAYLASISASAACSKNISGRSIK
jgi:hypothetical protein